MNGYTQVVKILRNHMANKFMDIIRNFLIALVISRVAVKHAIRYPTHSLPNKQPPNIHITTPTAIQRKGMESEEDEDLLLPDVAPFEESPLELICPHCDEKVFTTVTVSFLRWVGFNKNYIEWSCIWTRILITLKIWVFRRALLHRSVLCFRPIRALVPALQEDRGDRLMRRLRFDVMLHIIWGTPWIASTSTWNTFYTTTTYL